MDKMEAIEFLQRDLIKYFDSRFNKSCSGVQFVNIIDEFLDNAKPLSSHAVLGEVLALETEDFHTEEDWIRKEDVLNILGKYYA